MEGTGKEVYFHKFCNKCTHEKVDENKEPCSECIAVSGREYSHKPLYFESKEQKDET